MTFATIRSTTAMALPGAGAGADGMVGAAGTAGVLTTAVGHGDGVGTLPGMTLGMILGTDPDGVGVVITTGLGVRLPYPLTCSADRWAH